MLRWLTHLTITYCILGWNSVGAAKKPAFLLTTPSSFMPGENQTLAFNVFNAPRSGHVTLSLVATPGGVLSNVSIRTDGDSPEVITLPVPKDLPFNTVLQVSGKFGSYSFEKTVPAIVKKTDKKLVTIIQTDKPIYKARETVRFRVLGIDFRKLPLAEHVGQIWIENPMHFKISQWHNVSMSAGIVQLEKQLSHEPQLGEWSVCCQIFDHTTCQAFQVGSYALPKFSVDITAPPYIFPEESNSTWKICARYFYGKPVHGHLRAQLTYKRFPWTSELKKVLPSIDIDVPIRGCHEFEVNGNHLLFANRDINRRPLILTAEVADSATGEAVSANITKEFVWSPFTLGFVTKRSVPNFKPGLVYRGLVQATYPDGTPASEKRVSVCFSASSLPTVRCSARRKPQCQRVSSTDDVATGCRDYETDAQGQAHFSVPGMRGTLNSLSLTATSDGGKWNNPVSRMHLRAWTSMSGRYLHISVPSEKLECSRSTSILFYHTKLRNHPEGVTLYYQVVSGHQVVDKGILSPRRSWDDIAYRIPLDSSSSSMRVSGYSVSEFNLTVKPSWGLSPTARLMVYYAHPNGEVIADAVPLEVKPCNSNEVLLNFAEKSVQPGMPATLSLSAAQGSVCGTWALDQALLQKAAKAEFTPEKLHDFLSPLVAKPHRPTILKGHCVLSEENWHFAGPTLFLDSAAAFAESSVQVITDMKINVRPCWEDGGVWTPEHGARVGIDDGGDGEIADLAPATSIPKSAVDVRSHFPETWLWELHHIERAASLNLSREIPHSVTKWKAGALCLHPTRGLGMAADTVNAVQPFFIQLSLPAVAIRGETIPITASLFNYLRSCIPVKFGLIVDASCLKIIGSPQKRFCLCSEDTVSLRLYARSDCLGQLNITAHALGLSKNDSICEPGSVTETRTARDALRKSLHVMTEGTPRERSVSEYVCLKAPTSSTGNHRFILKIPGNAIHGSSKGVFTVSGDILSPVLASGLESIVKLPTACGEQNLAILATNVVVLDYLISSGHFSHPLEAKLRRNILTGYEQQLNYRHPHNGYSAFGGADPEPSLWLTAFVVRTYGKARQYVSLDDTELSLNTQWLLGHQYDTGCFPSVGRVLNSQLKGGIQGTSLSPLTAYVLISLLEANATLLPQAQDKAVQCLVEESAQEQDSYSLALHAYALTLLRHRNAQQTFHLLWSRGELEADGTLHWSRNVSLAVAVETSGYAILSCLTLHKETGVSLALPAVQWLLKQRNHRGGFISTQDTVIAMQALAKYAKMVVLPDTRLTLTVSSQHMEPRDLHVEPANAMLLQEMPVPVLPATLELNVTGKGCAFVQATAKYNVPAPTNTNNFDLLVEPSHTACKPRLKLCASYLLSWGMSGMVIIQVHLQTGFRFSKVIDDLEVKKIEEEMNKVNLYFDELSNQRTCVTLVLTQEYEVRNALPAAVILQDYYDPDMIVLRNYTIPTCERDQQNVVDSQVPFQLDVVQESVPSEGAHLSNFRNIDQEPDFPDGPESNLPVTVPAPED
ncbi:alpha-2-macroglobulin-like [Rhipicephalus microplus]|uniref:alpha-2-macroglobulin-like n=1 Tax=Rhipicephalus microplus TaxID=6941 RepID=UPI003F6B35A2